MENKIGENIRYYRQKAGIKQGDFAKSLGVTATTLSKIEMAGGSIRFDMLKEISKKLDIPLEKLIFGDDSILLNQDVLEKLKKE